MKSFLFRSWRGPFVVTGFALLTGCGGSDAPPIDVGGDPVSGDAGRDATQPPAPQDGAIPAEASSGEGGDDGASDGSPDAPASVGPVDAAIESSVEDAGSETGAADAGSDADAAGGDANAGDAALDSSVTGPDGAADAAVDAANPQDAAVDAASPADAAAPSDAAAPNDAGADSASPACADPDAGGAGPYAVLSSNSNSLADYFAVDLDGRCRHWFPYSDIVSISPDGTHLAYRSTVSASVSAVFIASASHIDAPVQIALTSAGTPYFFLGKWSPDSHYFTYGLYQPSSPTAGQDTTDTYVVSADGTGAHLLQAGVNPSAMTWSPDSTQVAYPIALVSPIVAFACPDRDCLRYAAALPLGALAITWAPDTKHVAVLGDMSQNHQQLFVVDTSTGQNVQISHVTTPMLQAGYDPAWSPSSKRIAYDDYYAQPSDAGVVDVFAACADGSCQTSLTASIASAGFSSTGLLSWGATDARVAFLAQPTSAAPDGPFRLFTACPDGSCWNDFGITGGYLWSKTRAYLYYVAVDSTASTSTLTAACPDGSCKYALGPATSFGFNSDSRSALLSPSKSSLAFKNGSDVYVMPTDLATPVRISRPGETTANGDMAWTPDGAMLVYATTPAGGVVAACVDGSCRKGTAAAGSSEGYVYGVLAAGP